MTSVHRFGRIEVRRIERQILVNGQPRAVGARALDVLLALIEHRDRVVSKSELLRLVWPGLIVEEANIHVQVSALRKVIGDDAIATIPGIGYRFALPPTEGAEQASRVNESAALLTAGPEPPKAAGRSGARRSTEAASASPKVWRPRLPRTYLRERLFEALDNAGPCPVLWIEGPPGAGKTTLVASYLDERGIHAAWYRIDSGDADIATFFHFLALSSDAGGGDGAASLPALTPDHFPTVAFFAQQFFAALFSRLKPPFALVFDNYQNIAAEAPLHGLLAQLAEALPDGFRIFVISREEPPVPFARLRLHGALSRVTEMELRLSDDEAVAVARWRDESFATQARACSLNDRARGWFAGYILLLNGEGTAPASLEATQDFSVLFDYFKREVFDRLAPSVRRVLLATATTPYVTPRLVCELAGSSDGEAVLLNLQRQNCFIESMNRGDSFCMHPLFRQFLLAHRAHVFEPAQDIALTRKAAQLLEADGMFEDACALYRKACDWHAMTRLILGNAPQMARQMRLQTLGHWIDDLPDRIVDDDPWLNYWRGMCSLRLLPSDARADFARACSGFDAGDDADGMYLSLAGIADSILIEWADFTLVESWFRRFEKVVTKHPLVTPEIEPPVVLAAIYMLTHRYLGHPGLRQWLNRADELWREHPRVQWDGWVALRMMVYFHAQWTGKIDKAWQVAHELTACDSDPHGSPTSRLHRWNFLAVHEWMLGSPRAALGFVEEGLTLIESYGIVSWKELVCAQGAIAGALCGELERSAKYLAMMKQGGDDANRGNLWGHYYHTAAAYSCLENSEIDAAVAHAVRALALGRAAEFTLGIARALVACACAAVLQQDFTRAAGLIREGRAVGEETESALILHWCQFVETGMAFVSDAKETAIDLLQETLAQSRAMLGPAIPGMPRSLLARLFALALERSIEPDHVTSLIRRFEIPAARDLPYIDAWPFRIKVYALGRFALVVNETPFRADAKAQKKPLELLKALIALRGRFVAAHTLADALWPDAEADMAQQNLKVTLHRLRRIIGSEAIEVQEGKLSLSSQHCWVDAWAFERHASAVLEMGQDDPQLSATVIDQAVALYRGPFLDGEELPIALSHRERLRDKAIRTIRRAVQQLQRHGMHERAVEYLERGLAIDPSENLYQSLMTSHLLLGSAADALQVFDRCCRHLHDTLGIEPSSATRALRQQALVARGDKR